MDHPNPKKFAAPCGRPALLFLYTLLSQSRRAVLHNLPDVGGWVPLAAFLRLPQVKQAKAANHCIRFLNGSRRDAWKSATGHNPVKGRDWDLKKTKAGGGAGHGTIHCTKSFLKHVFLKYYARP